MHLVVVLGERRVAGKEGVGGGCSFYKKKQNKLKSEIFNDKKKRLCTKMFFSAITNNIIWILTQHLVTFKSWEKMERG